MSRLHLWNSKPIIIYEMVLKIFFFPEEGKTGRGETLGRTEKLDWNLKKKFFFTS